MSTDPLAGPILPRSRIIRAEQTDALLSGEDLAARAARAEEESRRLLQRKAEEATRDARQQGYEAGRRDALRAASALIIKVRTSVDRELERAEAEIEAAALKVVRRVLGDMPVADKVAAAAAAVVADLRSARRLDIRVHPAAAERVEAAIAGLRADSRPLPALNVTPDDGLPEDACRVDSDLGVIDADVSLQLEAIELALRDDRPEGKA
ncbi:FliH/SctL family protein [Futiania mangrovi]|uniref:Flagellar assembly protein FliH n=1 Tax=Futiania mangrovi TaxID=2959716 RepID=A0A9J6PG79_9PROT|nr:FliH/SctL family protein [Futiania mangrovii]MCP1336803.1 FliH/SctL family protein [Futiania mangrovii]